MKPGSTIPNTDTIIFLHIPKTGGRSLQSILLRKYSSDEVITDAHNNLGEISEWSEERKRRIRYLQGHFIYGAHNVLPQDCSYITNLRDPIDRVISHYYFIRRSTGHPLHDVVIQQDMSLEDYVTSGVCDEVSNDQARLIAGVSRDSPVALDEMLKMAKDNIDNKFLVVGLLEEFNKTLVLLKKRLGLRNIFYGIRNQTIGRPLKEQTPERTLDLISERNYADIELYAYAEERLAKTIEEEGPAFMKAVRKFELLNRPYSNIFHLARVVKNKVLNG